MFSNKLKQLLLLLPLLLLAGCNDIADDLFPSGSDERSTVDANDPGIGYQPGQYSADFTLPDINGDQFTLSEHLSDGSDPADAVVLYFTMWCPICLSHSDHMSYAIVPQFADRLDVRYLLVDYVSGTVEAAYTTAAANGYVGGAIETVVDADLEVMDQLHAAMGTTIVIDGNGVIRMNEDYRSGDKLAETLEVIAAEGVQQ